MRLSLFIYYWNFSSYDEEYFLAQLSFYDTVVINCIHSLLKDEAHIREKFNWETLQDFNALENSAVEVDDDLASEVVVEHSK